MFFDIETEDDKITKMPSLLKNMNDSKKPVFVLLFLDGCGPCNEARNEWKKLPENFNDQENIIIASVNSDYMDELPLKTKPNSFPTIKYIKSPSKEITMVDDGPRTTESFSKFILSNIPKISNKNKYTKKKSYTKQHKQSLKLKKRLKQSKLQKRKSTIRIKKY